MTDNRIDIDPVFGFHLGFVRQCRTGAVILSLMMFISVICSKMVPNLSEMEFRTFVRIQKAIWDQLLASRAEII